MKTLEENAEKAQAIQDKRIAKGKRYIRKQNMIALCIDNGVCPQCGGKLRALGRIYKYGLFKQNEFYSADVDIICTKCNYQYKGYPCEDLAYKVEY